MTSEVAPDVPDLKLLLQACKEVDAQPSPLTDAHAHAFFSDFSLERLFRALDGARHKEDAALVSNALGKLLATELGLSMLPGSMPYLEAAAASPLPPLRRLAAEQYDRLLASCVRQQQQLLQHNAASAAGGGGGGRGDNEEVIAASCLQLVRILADPDTTVAAAAVRALRAYGSGGGLGALQRLLGEGAPVAAALAAAAEGDAGGTVRLRVLQLALELAAGVEGSATEGRASGHQPSPPSATATANGNGIHDSSSSSSNSGNPEEYGERLQLLRGSGLLQPLLKQLGDPSDALACLAALQLLEELLAGSSSSTSDSGSSRGEEGMAVALAGLALPELLRLVSDPLLSDAAMPLVAGIVRRSLPEALPAATASAVAASAAAAAAAAAVGMPEAPVAGVAAAVAAAAAPALRAAPALLAAVRGVLDDAGDASAAAEACGLDASGTLGQSRAGAQLVLADGVVVRGLCGRALGRSPHPEVRCAALHAVASVAGLERAGEDRARAAAILPAQCEEALRRGVFDACGLRRPGEVLLGWLGQPFPELRMAAYRCIAALALRSWFAVELVTTPDLMDRLLSASSESGAAACSWRHAAAAALWASVAAAGRGEVAAAGEEAYVATLAAPAVADRVRAAVQAGPYGADGPGGAAAAAAAARMHEQHLVATRGGGGGV